MRARPWLGVVLAGSLVGFGVFLVSCGGESPTGPETANIVVRLTDGPTDQLSQVNIYFVGLWVKREGEPVERGIPIMLPNNPQDLLQLRGRVVTLAAGTVVHGTYEWVRIKLDQSRSNVVEKDGTVKTLRIPSEEVKIFGPFVVDENTPTSFMLDFDADRSLHQLGNGDWLLNPVIVVAGAG